MLVIPEYTPHNGTKVRAKVKTGGSFELDLDTELLDILRNEAESLGRGIEQIAYYASEE